MDESIPLHRIKTFKKFRSASFLSPPSSTRICQILTHFAKNRCLSPTIANSSKNTRTICSTRHARETRARYFTNDSDYTKPRDSQIYEYLQALTACTFLSQVRYVVTTSEANSNGKTKRNGIAI